MLASVDPISEGVSATAIPASFRAAFLASAVPLPPEIMAPAWPILRPGGAVAPAIKAATGFLQFSLNKSDCDIISIGVIQKFQKMASWGSK